MTDGFATQNLQNNEPEKFFDFSGEETHRNELNFFEGKMMRSTGCVDEHDGWFCNAKPNKQKESLSFSERLSSFFINFARLQKNSAEWTSRTEGGNRKKRCRTNAFCPCEARGYPKT